MVWRGVIMDGFENSGEGVYNGILLPGESRTATKPKVGLL